MIARREFLIQTAGLAALGAAARAGYSQPAVIPQPDRAKGGIVPAPPFDLEITITGLCLFLRGNSKMHVLMVAPRKGERHYPRVFYDAAHDCQVAPRTFWRVVPLERTVLDLSGLPLQSPGSIPDVSDIPKLLDVRKYTPHTLKDPEQFATPNLACRVALPAGSVDTPERIGTWKLGASGSVPASVQQEVAWKVVWTVSGITDSALNWKLGTLLVGDPLESLPPLQPIADPGPNGKKMIRLTISNVVRGESTHDLPKGVAPTPGSKLQHFRAFLDLYANTGPWPDLIYTGPPAEAPQGTPYTCLPSGGH